MKRLSVILLSLGLPLTSLAKLPETVDFNDHIQPIISEKCYHCHGPDSSTRAPKKNPLRLDLEEYAFQPRSNGKPTIIKGDAEASELFKRVITTDVDDVMPPPESHKKPLDAGEIALIKKWINQGAPYEEHWSFIKPVKPAPPEGDWGHNPVDRFIAAKHREKKLKPALPQDPARLFRRLTFDLTGLPPTPAEISAFREMASADLSTAVELTVARLITTEAYAEHFARHWLDAARYADTHGIHIDNYRTIWPYRDWVIEAFRQNMPFDQFTREQIAGDLLPNPSLDQKIATGFNRCIPTTGEGGAIDKEYEAIYAADQVSTTSALWLGLSTGCAACHDHKFDPISQKDFYSLTAFFRNTTMKAMDRNQADHAPTVFAPRLADRPRLLSIEEEITQIKNDLKIRREEGDPDFQKWLQIQRGNTKVIKGPSEEFDLELPLVAEGGQLTLTESKTSKKTAFEGAFREVPDLGKVPELGDLNLTLGDFAKIEAGEQVTFIGRLYLEEGAHGPLLSRMDSKANYRGWDLWLDEGKLGAHFIENWPDKAIKAVTATPLEPKNWHDFAIIYDGQAKPTDRLTVMVDNKIAKLDQTHSGEVSTIQTRAPLRLGGRHSGIALKGKASLHSLKMVRRKLPENDIRDSSFLSEFQLALSILPEEQTEAQKNTISSHFFNYVDPKSISLTDRIEKLTARQKEIKNRGSATLVMQEKPGEAYAHLLERGDYSLEKEKVFAAIPEVFKYNPGDRKLNRKDLADWLVSEDNPLTARVTVNRLWYYLFGHGLVETTEDFGIMGAQPTHPKLLDYLATELVDHNWDLQHIIKLITSSATYQQSAKTTSANREKDSENTYLWRAPRHRLEAEQLRDLALAASGLLVKKVGGPSVKPYQPEGIWEAVAMKQSNTRFYKQDQGEGLYRRSLYTFWKRTAAPPSMEILNAPTREVFCVRRDRTNTPLAAFVTMNDTQFIEASRALATRALLQAQAFSQRLDHLTMALMARTMTNEEQEVIKKALDHHLDHYQKNPGLADQLISVGESPPAPTIPAPELAAWTLIASQIFNLDETLTK